MEAELRNTHTIHTSTSWGNIHYRGRTLKYSGFAQFFDCLSNHQPRRTDCISPWEETVPRLCRRPRSLCPSYDRLMHFLLSFSSRYYYSGCHPDAHCRRRSILMDDQSLILQSNNAEICVIFHAVILIIGLSWSGFICVASGHLELMYIIKDHSNVIRTTL